MWVSQDAVAAPRETTGGTRVTEVRAAAQGCLAGHVLLRPLLTLLRLTPGPREDAGSGRRDSR